MPASYRESDERAEDRIIYFDYARALEQKRRPIPWGTVVGFGTALALSTFVGSLAYSGSVALAALLASIGFVTAAGTIPLIRVQRALSGQNLVEVRRRGALAPPAYVSEKR
jgi:hypothetical protein